MPVKGLPEELTAEVMELLDSPGVSHIPDELAEYLETQELRASWTPYQKNNVNTLFGQGVKPLTLTDLVDDGEGELARHIQKTMAVENDFIRNGDCLLVVQRKSLWDQKVARARARHALQSGGNGEEIREALNELARRTGHGTGDVARVDIGPVEDYVEVR